MTDSLSSYHSNVWILATWNTEFTFISICFAIWATYWIIYLNTSHIWTAVALGYLSLYFNHFSKERLLTMTIAGLLQLAALRAHSLPYVIPSEPHTGLRSIGQTRSWQLYSLDDSDISFWLFYVASFSRLIWLEDYLDNNKIPKWISVANKTD